jgi:flagellar P-ring protein precursor FlgI
MAERRAKRQHGKGFPGCPRPRSGSHPRLIAWILVLASGLMLAADARAVRLKDVASIRGVRSNQLIGYGLVVGLKGTGDDQQVYFTLRSVQLMLRRLGVQAANDKTFNLQNLRLRNAAAVMVTAQLPPFVRAGTRLNVTVSSLGNATSLEGGTLLMTPLRGVDLKVYALAQGAVSIGGGFSARGRTGSRVQKNHTTVARVPLGAIVEREVPSRFVVNKQMVVALRRPDFTTARRLAEAINKAMGEKIANPKDPATIVVKVPKAYAKRTVALASKLEVVRVKPDQPAQVIINERTGTVVIGSNVRLRPVAISHGSLTLEVNERFKVSQPKAFGRGRTRVVPKTDIKATVRGGPIRLLDPGANPSDVVKALNALGASPRDLVAIFQALEQAGALPAKLIIQ